MTLFYLVWCHRMGRAPWFCGQEVWVWDESLSLSGLWFPHLKMSDAGDISNILSLNKKNEMVDWGRGLSLLLDLSLVPEEPLKRRLGLQNIHYHLWSNDFSDLSSAWDLTSKLSLNSCVTLDLSFHSFLYLYDEGLGHMIWEPSWLYSPGCTVLITLAV